MAPALRPYQQEAVERLRAAFRHGHRAVLFVLPTGGGKCLGRGTPILMFDGTVKPVEDVRPGDQLMGPDSRPRNVLSTCAGREPLYRVVPKKGDPYVVNESHVLSLRMTPGNRIGHSPDAIVNITVRDYLRQTQTFRHCAKGWRAAVEFPQAAEPLPIPSYMLGVWLGDGSRRAFSITTGEPEIEAEVMAFAADRGMAVRREANSLGSENLHVVGALGHRANRYGRGGNPLLNELRAMGLTTEKRIPHRYLTGTRSERLELLAGILDTDGSYTGKGFDLCLKSEALFDDVLFLARSLGFAAYKEIERTCINTGATGVYFRCSISGDVDLIPTRIPRKQAAPRRQIKNPLRHGIHLEPLGDGDYFGFTIDGDHLFMLGDFTVTHNTVVFSHIAQQAAHRGKRIAVLVHRVELLEQASRSLDALGVRHGLIAAGRAMNLAAPVQVASVGTLTRRLSQLPPTFFQLLVVDEAHHSNAGQWSRIIQHFQAAHLLGVTATPIRSDGRGLGEFYSELVLGPSAAWLTAHGFLAEARVFAPPCDFEAQRLRKRMGDYDLRQAAAALGGARILGDAVSHYRQHLQGQSAIGFCCSVAHAQVVAEAFQRAGIPAACIDGSLDAATRRALIERLGSGDLQVLTSCSLIGEGVDVPSVGGCILLRPTQSEALHLQMIGRCLRPQAGKQAVILDHVGNIVRLGHHLEERPWSLDGVRRRHRQQAPSVKTCPQCFCAMATRAPRCPECGHQFRPERRSYAVLAGELQEVTAQELKQQRKREQLEARSLQELIALGERRGMKNPRGWAQHVLAARQTKGHWSRVA